MIANSINSIIQLSMILSLLRSMILKKNNLHKDFDMNSIFLFILDRPISGRFIKKLLNLSASKRSKSENTNMEF